MIQEGLVAQASTTIAAPATAVWHALTTPESVRQFMFGTEVVSDWTQGSSIVWRGEYQGKAYEDHGTILAIEPPRLLQYSHYSPLSGAPDVPENYHTVTYRLTDQGDTTQVTLTQDHNASEKERDHSSENWGQMLVRLKDCVEGAGQA